MKDGRLKKTRIVSKSGQSSVSKPFRARPHVALIVETAVVYGREILRGIARYLRNQGPWSIYLEERELGAPPPDWLADWKGDGIICRPMNPSLARVMAKRRIPLIDLNDWYRGLGFPQIVSDMEAIGALGAEHLIERGFRNLAFCGFSGELWCNERQAGFARVAREHGGNLCGTYATPWADLRAHPWQVERDWIARWLRTLPRPLGVMACNDVRGQHVLDACAQIKASVPDEIAVVGVDNSEPFCELCSPPLSSVVPNAERIGYEAAALLDGWLRGEKVEPITRKILPLNVVARQSTDTLAIEDLPIARAVGYIREHACNGLSVDAVLRHVPVGRSVLERRFRKYLGHSPQEEIHRVRLKRIQQLLAETDWKLDRIADATGFEHPEYLSVFFKKATGKTPGEYRRSVSLKTVEKHSDA